MSLIDIYLKQASFNEVHSITINGSAEECYNATLNLDLSKSKTMTFLFKLRGLPFQKTRFLEFTKGMKFTLLEENRFNEFIYGFWAHTQIEWIDDKDDFIHREEGFHLKSVWNFRYIQQDVEFCKVVTETRVKCLTRRAKIFFSIYWFFIRPFSGLIRTLMLKLLKKEVETNKVKFNLDK